MNVTIGKLKEGDWRLLTHIEMQEIRNAINSSSNTPKISPEAKLRRKSPKNRINFTNKKSNASRKKAKSSANNPKPSSNKSSYSSYKKKRK